MSIPWALRPGAGFVLLATVIVSSAAFFAWGMSAPSLDDVWRIQVELRIGRTKPLRDRERKIISRAMCRHPELADALIGEEKIGVISAHREGFVEVGHAAIVRKPSAKRAVIEVEPASEGAITVRVDTKSDRKKGEAKRGAPFVLELSDETQCPELVGLVFDQSNNEKKKRARAVSVRVKEQP